MKHGWMDHPAWPISTPLHCRLRQPSKLTPCMHIVAFAIAYSCLAHADRPAKTKPMHQDIRVSQFVTDKMDCQDRWCFTNSVGRKEERRVFIAMFHLKWLYGRLLLWKQKGICERWNQMHVSPECFSFQPVDFLVKAWSLQADSFHQGCENRGEMDGCVK